MTTNGVNHEAKEPFDNALSRQMTVALTPEQYERLFFQPSEAKGDLAKRLGNPTLLGLLGFLVPFSVTMFACLEFKGSSTASFASILGAWYFFGGIAMNVAAICEFILGNTFPFVVFMIYGVHWVVIGYTMDPWHPLLAGYGNVAEPATALNEAYTSGQGLYDIVMALVSFIFLLGSLRTNVPFVIVFFTLVFLFGFFAAGEFELGHNPTAAGVEYATTMFKVGGAFGFVTLIMGWYLAIITVCASTGVPCPLPVFDLSQKLFAHNKAQVEEHAGAVRRGSVEAV